MYFQNATQKTSPFPMLRENKIQEQKKETERERERNWTTSLAYCTLSIACTYG